MTSASTSADMLLDRLCGLWERTGDAALHRLSVGGQLQGPLSEVEPFDPASEDEIDKADVTSPEFADWVSTALMDSYRKTGDGQVFALLYELNERAFLQAIQFQIRGAARVDRHDVLQDAFLNIYRYPHRFAAEKADSFRNWGHRIVRNTLLKALKGETRRSRVVSLEEDLGQRADVAAARPDRRAADAEIAHVVDDAFVLYLNLYWLHFQQLSPREKRALTMVEIDGASYKEAAADLGIRLENLKMVIFRGRRKILRNMQRSLQAMPAATSKPNSLHSSSASEHAAIAAAEAISSTH